MVLYILFSFQVPESNTRRVLLDITEKGTFTADAENPQCNAVSFLSSYVVTGQEM